MWNLVCALQESLPLSALLCSHTQDLPAFNAKCSEGSSSECLTRRLSWSAVFMWECPCVACVGLISFAGEVRVLSCARLLRPHGLYSLAASSVHGILQARILTWAAMSFSRGSSRPRAQTWVSCVAGRFFTISHFCWWKWSLSVVSESLWPHWLQPTRLLRPWDLPGENTGVGCHVLLQGLFPTQVSRVVADALPSEPRGKSTLLAGL